MLKKSVIISLCFLFSLLSSATHASNSLPDIGTVGAGALTIEKEKEYGWAFRLMANQGLPIIHDPVLNYYIEDLGQNLVSHADSVKLPFNFFLIDDKEINAAAFLGGNVKIHTGLFLYAQNESELAGVIAHEIAHITQRHLARMIEQQSFSNPASLAALAGSLLLAVVSPTAGMAALTTTMAVTAQSQINYTRLHEYEADRIGIQTLAGAGYNPYGMADFFSKLAEKYKYANMPPQMLSTHPLPETRLAESRLRAGQFEKKHYKNSLDYQLSKARITVRYNNISAKAAVSFYQSQIKNHKYQLKEAALYGLALAYFQNKDYEKAQEINAQLLKEQPGNLFYNDLAADTALALKNPKKIIAPLSALYKKTPNNPVIVLNLVIALQENKQYKEAEKKLELFIRSHPEHVLAHLLAIDLYKIMNIRSKEYASRAQYLALQGRFREASQEMGSALVYADKKLDQARYSAKIELYKKDDLRLQSLK
ncbi:M48 family metalloprotease [Psychromonas aquimarina]|uniref:beta-barrel assembly-enhancing protease n=1 Tax=Psychromonas aquimarina TaxID=444919 RepID=UPI0004161B59|nr:M48 family metalloprotease [Psychromonas aquimarina]